MAPRGRRLDTKATTRFSRGAVSKKAIKLEPGCVPKKPAQFEQWIYRFLDHLCAAENKCETYSKPKVEPKRSKSSKQYRAPTPYTWDHRPTSSVGEEDEVSSRCNFHDEDICLREENLKDLKFLISRARDVNFLVPNRTSDRNLLQKINLYINAGLAEGKRRAKRYVRRALNFALDTGYVVQMDDDGMVFQVSPTLLSDDEKASGKVPPESPNPVTTSEPVEKSNSNFGTKRRGRSSASTRRRASTAGRRRRASTNKRAAKRTYRRKTSNHSREKVYICPHHRAEMRKKKEEEAKPAATGGETNGTVTPKSQTPNQQPPAPPRGFKENKPNEPGKKSSGEISRNSSRSIHQDQRNNENPHVSEDRRSQSYRARTCSSTRDKK